MSVLTKVSESTKCSTEYLEHFNYADDIQKVMIGHLQDEINDFDFKNTFYDILNKGMYLPSKLVGVCINIGVLMDLQGKSKPEHDSFLNSSIMKLKDTDYKISKTELLYIIVKCNTIYHRENSVDKCQNLWI